MIRNILITVLLSASIVLGADGPAVHEKSTAPKDATFEIVQSTLAAKLTFRLNRVTGKIWQLVQNEDGELSWAPVPVVALYRVPASSPPRFQIFESGLLARHTFLLDALTGQVWIFTESSENKRRWQPMPIDEEAQ